MELKDIVVSLKQDMLDTRASVENLNSRLTSFEQTLSFLVQTQKEQQSEIEAIKKSLEEVSTGKEKAINETIHEMEARYQRKRNLIMFGIEEKRDGSVEERREFDEQQVDSILSAIGLSDLSYDGLRRIGKPQHSKPRLIRITCSDEDERTEALNAARKLRTLVNYNGIFINADLTPMQQKQQRQLREELKRRRNAGENVKIRRGAIVITDNQNFR